MTALVVLCMLAVFVAYGWFEAGWLRANVIEVPLPGLPPALDGLRIGHLSDFHLGAPLSRGNKASAEAVAWVAERRPDLVCISGDLVSHPRGEPLLGALMEQLEAPVVVLGNHDVDVTRDPFSRSAELHALEGVQLLRDQEIGVVRRGERISVVGIDPRTYRMKLACPNTLVSPQARLRLLVCHFPAIALRIPAASFDLILAGHVHGGQICLPLPGRRVTLAHPRARFVAGVYETPAGVMHVSSGTGTTFVPLRFFARPEVTEIVLRAA